MLHFSETSTKNIVLKPEYNKHCMTYCDIPPSRVIAQSVCNVVAQTFGQIVHELCALYMKTQNISQIYVMSNINLDINGDYTKCLDVYETIQIILYYTRALIVSVCDKRDSSIKFSRQYVGVSNSRNQ